MRKNIFITGIAGFLGSNLAEFYIKKGFKVSGCDNLVGGDLKNIDLKKINFFKADCENLDFMTKIMKNIDILKTQYFTGEELLNILKIKI
jgi:nucleoside-diphosphate-sugar epimerase